VKYFTTKATVSQPDFLNHLFSGTSGYLELTYLQPPGQRPDLPHIVTESYQLGRERPDWEHVAAMNTDGYGVYYGLTIKNTRPDFGHRSKESAAAWVSVLWVDIDLKDGAYPDKEAIYTAICDLLHPATVIIDSGGGLHALWRITPVRVTEQNFQFIKDVLRGVAVALHGDPSVAELSRVFRLPGTVNTKPERDGARCEIVSWLPGELDLEQFAGYRILAQPAHQPPRDYARIKPDNEPGYIRWYLDGTQSEGERNSALNWTAYKMFCDGYSQTEAEALLLAHAVNGGLSEKESLRTIASAFRGKSGTPSYIGKRDKARMNAGDVIGGEM
jgi:hypothetical protein